jgi:CRISPR-associated protein Cmr1
MPREIPDFLENWKTPTVNAGRSYDIELITPMFGGGVETRVNDPTFPIRPTAIRGQLQFWWRATVGAKFATKEELRSEQSAVWGSTEQASPVQLLVERIQADRPEPCAKIEWNSNARRGQGAWRINWQPPFDAQDSSLPYALFAFQGETPPPRQNAETGTPPAACIRQARFRLVIRCPDKLWPQVEPVVWAWVNFGGIGSRTRRGCGAIVGREVDQDGKVKPELAPMDANDLSAKWKQYMPELFPAREWPTMAAAILTGEPITNPIDAWSEVIGKLRFFRQGANFARDPGSPPSRSRFPEPDTIRRITDSWKPGHEPRDEIPDGFPRAEFGLPIVFHFKDGKNDASDSRALEPYETVLQPFFAQMTAGAAELDSEGLPVGVTRDRMASPLILRPVQLARGKYVPAIVCLHAILPERVELQDNRTPDILTYQRVERPVSPCLPTRKHR